MSDTITANIDRLESVDETLRTNTVGVYLACLRLSELVGDASIYPITLEEARTHNLSPIGETLHSDGGRDIVTFGVELSEYELYASGVLRARYPGCRALIDLQESKQDKLLRLVEIVLAHEVGHVDNLQAERLLKGEERAFMDYMATYDFSLSTLPLTTSTTLAMEWWQNDTNGYRTYLMNVGYTDENFMLKCLENAEAYGLIPQEKFADDFAERVMRELYDF